MAKRSTMKRGQLPAHSSTMAGIQAWHVAKVEKLGWMVMAKAKGYDYKVASYKKEIGALIDTIKHVMGEYQDPDRKHDLNVMLMNTMVLHDFVNKHL